VYGLSLSAKFGAPSNLYTSTPTGTGTMQLTRDGVSAYPVWGKLGIVFDWISNRGLQKAPAYQLYLLNGGHATQITHMRIAPLLDGLVPIQVSADGTRLAAEFEGEDTGNAYAVNLVTHKVRELLVKGQTVTCWGISSDGKRVLVDFGGFMNPPSAGTIETVPFSGGSSTVLVRHANYASWNR
jgi:hypothetical protein